MSSAKRVRKFPSKGGRIVLTLELARASAWDAACANMRKHGRTAWNEDDQAVACDKLYSLMRYLPAPYPEIARRMQGAA